MPSYSTHSPSLRKMEMGGRYGAGPKKRFNLGNIIGDPFPLATIGIAFSGWMIAFVSSVIADLDSNYPNFAWWALVYMFFCILGVVITVGSDSVYTFHVAIVGFLAAGLVFTVSSVNSLIYYPEASKEAAAAGFILLSMVSIVWIFYYGSQPTASHRRTMDSFALHKERAPSARGSRNMAQSTTQSTAPAQTYHSTLPGFETASPVTAFSGGAVGQQHRASGAHSFATAQAPQSQTQLQPPSAIPPPTVAAVPPPQDPAPETAPETTAADPMDYKFRAKAIYNYTANPDDANEISFDKHEILEVSDVSGRWWQARKANGETGIAPSNYLILL